MPKDPAASPSAPAAADVELGCPTETLNGQEDHKILRREEFEGKLRDMGLELEKDEDVSLLLYSFVLPRNTRRATPTRVCDLPYGLVSS